MKMNIVYINSITDSTPCHRHRLDWLPVHDGYYEGVIKNNSPIFNSIIAVDSNYITTNVLHSI